MRSRSGGRCVTWGSVAASAVTGTAALARGPDAADATTTISLSALPREAQATEKLIRAGGPFPYSKDGSVFGNRERLLPRKPRGQYREYTVMTPGALNRGARRIVCAGAEPRAPEACYFSADHYSSFRRIVQ
jgi:ribonuclease T1